MPSSACPSVYHEFEGPEPIPYDTEGYFYILYITPKILNLISGTDRGNNYKVTQHSRFLALTSKANQNA